VARLPAAQENTGLNAMFLPSTTYYLALFTSDPSTTGASGEVTGGSYARQAIAFGSASAGSQASTNAQTFTNMPVEAGGVPYFGLFTASTSGTYLGGGLTSGLSGAISAGSTVTFAIGAVTTSLS
jgi:hypothetical protein